MGQLREGGQLGGPAVQEGDGSLVPGDRARRGKEEGQILEAVRRQG